MNSAEEQLPLRRGRQLRGRRIFGFVLIGVVIVFALAVAAATLLRQTNVIFPADLAQFAPAESLAYVNLDIRPILANPDGYAPTIKAAKESRFFTDLREGLERELHAKDVDFKEDIAAWLGPAAAIAVTDLPEAGLSTLPPSLDFSRRALPFRQLPGFLAILTVRDEGRAQRALGSLTKKLGARSERAEYQGDELITLRGGKLPEAITYALVGNLLLVSNRPEEVKSGLVRAEGQMTRLADAESYKRLFVDATHLQADRVLTYFFNTKVFARMISRMLPPEAAGLMGGQQFKYIDAVGGSATLLPNRLEIEILSWGANQAEDPTRKAIAKLPPVGGRAFQFLPKESAVALAVQSPVTYWRLLKQLSAGLPQPSGVNPLAQLQQALKSSAGLDLDADILGWMSGELALAVSAPPQPGAQSFSILPVEISLVIEDRDEATVQEKLARLRGAVQSMIAKGQQTSIWQERKAGKFTYHTLMLPLLPLRISLGQVGRIAFITSSPEAMERSFAAGLQQDNSIVSSPGYLQARESFPRRPIFLLFAEPSRFSGVTQDPTAVKLLNSFKRVTIGEHLLPQGARSVASLEMDFPQFIAALDETTKKAKGQGR